MECGQALPVGRPGGLCARCALRGALTGEVEGKSEFSAQPSEATQLSEIGPSTFSHAHLSRGARIGDYEVLAEIAHGGMGVVYKARQQSLNRWVAVKMLLPGLSSPEYLRRFRTEASTAAGLQHPNIVAIHEVGVWQGQQYLVMDYVDGPSLAQRMAEGGARRVDYKQSARWIQTVAEAVHFAHEHGILHRDLKPSNILIDPADQPRVTDFGLAKRLAQESQVTLSAQTLGSPSYMPPEQAESQRGKVSRRSDVYSMGATLYQLLTGRAPFHGETPAEVIHQVLNLDPVAPRLLNPGLPRDLETICLKCLEKEPSHRYATAQALADDLDRYLRHAPILARRIGPIGTAWRWCRRKPVVAGLSAGLLIALVLGFAGVTWQWRQAEGERQRERRTAYGYGIQAAQLALQQDDRIAAMALLEQQRPAPGQEDLRGMEWRFLWQESRSEELRSFLHPQWVRDAVLSPTGQYLASACFDRKVRIWDPASGKVLHEFECTDPLVPRNCLGFSPDGQWLVMPGTKTGPETHAAIEIRETTGWSLIHRLSPAQPPLGVSANGKVIVADGGDLNSNGQSLVVWNLSNQSQLRLTNAAARYRNLAISPDGTQIAYSANDPYIRRQPGAILLRDLSSGRTHVLATNELTLSLAISPDGKWLAAGHYLSGEVGFWDLTTRRSVLRFEAHRGPVCAVTFSPDGRILASGGIDKMIYFWQTGTSNRIGALRAHTIQSCTFSRHQETLVSAGTDDSVKLWRRPSAIHPRPPTISLPTNTIPYGILPNGRTLLALDERRIHTYLMNLPDGQLLGSNDWNQVAQQGCRRPRFFARNRMVAGMSANGTVHFWDLATTVLLRSIALGGIGFDPEFLSPNNRWMLGTSTNEAAFWDLHTRREILRFDLQAPLSHFFAADFSPDNRWLAYCDTTNGIHLWNLSTQRAQAMLTLPRQSPYITAIRFSPDSRLLAIGRWNGLWLWSVEDGTLRSEITTRPVSHVAFSADGKTLAASTEDLSIRCWSVASGQELLVLRNATMASGEYYPHLRVHYTTPAELNPGGNLMVWQTGKGLIRVTPLPPLAEIEAREHPLNHSPR